MTIELGDYEVQCKDCTIAALCDKDGRLKDVSIDGTPVLLAMSRRVITECQDMPLTTLCPDPAGVISERDAEEVLHQRGVVIDATDGRTARQVGLRMMALKRVRYNECNE